MKAESIVLMSGGMDSLVCAAVAKEASRSVAFLHMDYGQRTSVKEKSAAIAIAKHYGIPTELFKTIDVSFLGSIGGSSLTDASIDVSTYSGDKEGIPSSYVPFRNGIILSLAVSWAEVLGASKLYFGANWEDSPGYPDCRPEYYDVFNKLLKTGTKEGKIQIETPVIHMKKKDIVELGTRLSAPFNLSWSCYARTDKACGVCDSCALRLRGFREAHILDPIPYA